MTRLIECKVRPWPRNAKKNALRDDYRDMFKLFLSDAHVFRIKNGNICFLETSQGVVGPAIAWSAAEIKDNVVQTSHQLQKLYNLTLEDKISVSPSNQSFVDATHITLCNVPIDDQEVPPSSLDNEKKVCWACLLKEKLISAEMLTPGVVVDNATANGLKKSFQIQQINWSEARLPYRAHPTCKVEVIDARTYGGKQFNLFASNKGVGGLATQFQRINKKLEYFNTPLHDLIPGIKLHRPCDGGILLHGAKGTGKSLILRKIADAGWRGVFHLDETTFGLESVGNTVAIAQIFDNALASQPSVIIIDGLDSVCREKGAQGSGGFICQLLSKQLERLRGSRTLAVAAARNLSDLDQNLRAAQYFKTEIEIPVPDLNSRAEILKALGELPQCKSHSVLDDIASRTHGFVGADLETLMRDATDFFYDRMKQSLIDQGALETCKPIELEDQFTEMHHDLKNTLLSVRPTAMQEIFVEKPNVKWDDIGGQHEVKQVLEEALIWPIKYPDEMAECGAQPKKGLLLYGPPGCSKTMTAKAAAAQSGLNFLTVKGSELMSMYVGESERKLRGLFSKARAVRPCLIFFDEIDAIGTTRGAGQHGGVQTVTTLLNELDGFETLENVFVLAATNKPEVLDPALLRAGRLAQTIYVGLPDLRTRGDILRMQLRTMPRGHDIDEDALSELTDGYSGAEIVQLCENVRYAVLRERIETQEKRLVGQDHFNDALARLEKSVTKKMLQFYEAWGQSRQ